MTMRSKKDASTEAMTEAKQGRKSVTEDQIRRRAFEIFLARGAAPGQDLEDWLRAERELQASQKDRDQVARRSPQAIGG
jgi:hypothetical protein